MNTAFTILAALTVLAVVCWPRQGLLARRREARDLAARARREDTLKHILKCEAVGRVATLDSIAGALQITTSEAAELLDELESRDLLTFESGPLRLRPAGREMGLHVVRAHRLWESYLAEQTGVAEDEWHSRAEKKEHLLTPEQTQALSARLGHPMRDPHGDAIPAADGALENDHDHSLNSVAPETPVLITHLEDEPETVYRQLAAIGLRPGMRAFVIEKSAARIRFWADGNEHILAPVLAQNVTIRPLPEFQTADLIDEEFLSGLPAGRSAHVVGLSPACRGPERRRLLDLGFVPGTLVEVELTSPAGDPTAYRVRGSVVALRREQASLIRVSSREGVA
ncbi:MAG: metal-dependent transcriptional regulator [Planctomycetes bacterium]|nr:metal-dependent transcriptional regulator [Planctomycetota bacterium]